MGAIKLVALTLASLSALSACGGAKSPAARLPPPEYEEVELPPYEPERARDPLDQLPSGPAEPAPSEAAPSEPAPAEGAPAGPAEPAPASPVEPGPPSRPQ
jgi:hypothetical protein